MQHRGAESGWMGLEKVHMAAECRTSQPSKFCTFHSVLHFTFPSGLASYNFGANTEQAVKKLQFEVLVVKIFEHGLRKSRDTTDCLLTAMHI